MSIQILGCICHTILQISLFRLQHNKKQYESYLQYFLGKNILVEQSGISTLLAIWILLPSLRSGMAPPGQQGGCCCLQQLKGWITLLSFTFDSHMPRRLVIYAHCGYKHNIHCILSKYIPLFSEKNSNSFGRNTVKNYDAAIKYKFIIKKIITHHFNNLKEL